jgi:hypothetical protein
MSRRKATSLDPWTVLSFALALAPAPACRSEKAPEPAPAPATVASSAAPVPLPTQPPRFAWQPPLSALVDETAQQQGQRLQLRYWLDVCPGQSATLLVNHRDLRVTAVNEVSTSDPQVARQAESIEASASALPTMVIDRRSGALVAATGLTEMMDRLSQTYPRQDFSSLRRSVTSGGAALIFKPELASRWQSWVDLWLRFDPSRGPSQEITGDDARGGSTTLVSYKGGTTDKRVRFVATRLFSESELRQIGEFIAGKTGVADLDLDGGQRSAEVLSEVETDWPDVRPRWAHTRKTMRATAEGKVVRLVEDREYRFDWGVAAHGEPRCQ